MENIEDMRAGERMNSDLILHVNTEENLQNFEVKILCYF